jgi:hypothetical protein
MITLKKSLDKFNNKEDIIEAVEYIWELLQGSVKLSIKFIDFKRCPQMIEQPDGTKKKKYTKKAYSQVSIKDHKKIWEME